MRTWSLNLVILCASLFFSLLIAEALMRGFYGNIPQGSQHLMFLKEYDPLLGWRNVPNASGTYATSEYSVSERINSKGIRGPEYLYAKSNNEYRILILGDSFAEGFAVDFNKLFSEVLKKELNEDPGDRYYQVINTGTGGHSTDQELLLFQSVGKKYSPDLTILMFYDNDVWNNNQPKFWRLYKPLFQIEGNKLILTNVPVPKPVEDVALQMQYWFYSKSYLARFILDGIVAFQSKDSGSIPREFGVYRKQYHDDTYHAWKITKEIIVELEQETFANGSELLIFYIPVWPCIYLEELDKIRKQYGILDDGWDVEQVRNEIKAFCKMNKIDFIDPVESFRRTANDLKTKRERLYFLKDGHWNDNGHGLAAEILAEYVRHNYLNSQSK